MVYLLCVYLTMHGQTHIKLDLVLGNWRKLYDPNNFFLFYISLPYLDDAAFCYFLITRPNLESLLSRKKRNVVHLL